MHGMWLEGMNKQTRGQVYVITGKNVKFPCPGNVQYRAEFPVL